VDLFAALPAWIAQLPAPLGDIITTLLSPAVLGALGLSSVAMFVLSAIGLPWIVARLPADQFSRRDPARASDERHEAPPVRHPLRHAFRALRNGVGLLLFAAGLAMLVLPGQGLLTLLVALFLLDFPGKQAFQRRIIKNDTVFRGLNTLRRKMGAAPFQR